ncbi:DUF1800 domain-containing protein [Acidobacteria bacterium AB60]|nr:DUF1800 domain-containing protein [Acidobacteria bacterium AB60]
MKHLQGLWAASLCASLVVSSTPGMAAPSAAPPAKTANRSAYPAQIEGDERILHALNRFTFGPRPGDLEAVRRMSLDTWFEEQLHPANINDTALQVRLAEYPAMTWSPEDLLYRLPSKAVIRQVIDGKAPMPQQGALYAVYENEVTRLSAKRQEKEQKAAVATVVKTAGDSKIADGQQISASGTQMESPAEVKAPETDPNLVSALLALPPRDRVLRMTRMPQPQYDSLIKSIKGPQRQLLMSDLSPDLRETLGALENPERVVVEELMAQRLIRDVYSNAQLQEVMTDFWMNHFNVFLRKNEATPYYLVSYERDVIRPHALGKFEDLLQATAHSPAMLIYLDNMQSIGPDSMAAERAKIAAARDPDTKKKAPEGLNENYARELMELHTLGVNGGYSQQDVIQAARILTGWTVERPQRGGGFQFDPRRHEPGTKKVLGKKFKEQGEREGRELLHMLATHPSTARFISRKLAVRFVSDDPPQELVDRMAKTFLSSNGDIAAVLKTMFRSPEFWSTETYRAKVKTPLESVVSATRATNSNLTNVQPLVAALREMGMPLYGCIPPTGYKWDAADWVSTGALVNRMNFALSLAANRFNGVTTTWTSQETPTLTAKQPALNLLANLDSDAAPPPVQATTPASLQPTPQSEETRLESLLIGGSVSDSTRIAVLEQFAQQSQGMPATAPAMLNQKQTRPAPLPIEKQDQLLAGLLLGSPEFQRR